MSGENEELIAFAQEVKGSRRAAMNMTVDQIRQMAGCVVELNELREAAEARAAQMTGEET